ncbi:XrtA-associated tyrosine autokinase [Pseudodesulfovibrio thermohalotolerans]|uniref:XrtA-associated tyrosine autokinase n=1 Tax=Pseudodesulfovibrio thermohalotolerans TaxID=2880651 RepID=UPI0024435A4C|nr:XrtA-associated tyrosine autokinase [Pseudodesulfovibrio thermohalotolerans]WFS61606.1 XrtA-associated tyrosine autokinase [Pseudodesulfovibrio thermohalotolerans]
MSRIEDALKKASAKRSEKLRPESAGTAAPAETKIPGVDSAQASFLETAAMQTEAFERARGQRMLVSMNEPVSLAAEEFRKLKQSLVRKTKRSGFQNTLLVTSGTVGEGKSVTAVNLAISLAQEFDHTVLLVDADIRSPSCHELLCMENGYGLSDCLIEGAPISKGMVKTGIGKLSFLSAGSPVPNVGELLASKRMHETLSEMKNRYADRYIIIDSPPVLPFAESRNLSRMADGVVLVIKEGQASQADLRDTIEALQGSNILGAVYTQASRATRGLSAEAYMKYKYYHHAR